MFAGSAFEDNGSFELVGEFNSEGNWSEDRIEWVVDTSSGRGNDSG